MSVLRNAMNQKEQFLREVIQKVGDKVGEQCTSEKVEQFSKHGTLFLFFEVMNLRQEIECLKQKVIQIKNSQI